VIPHDPALDAAWGTLAWVPHARVSFTAPGGGSTPPQPVALPAGTFVDDSYVWPRQTLTLTLPTAVTPDRTQSPVSPYGGACTVDVGARVAGTDVWFRRATLDVVETRISRPDGTIVVKAASHEARVDEDRIDVRTSTSAGTATALITSLVRRTLGAGHPVTNLVPGGSDPAYAAGAFRLEGGVWQTIENIADASGIEAFFDANGSLVLRVVPVKGTPVATILTGPGGQLTGYDSTRGWAYNRVAVPYEDDAGSRVVGIWEDTVSTSATRVSGPYGRHTLRRDTIRVDTGKLPTQAVADRAAAAIGRRAAAPYRSVSMRTIPAPWLEPGDTVAVGLLGSLFETSLIVRHEFPIDALDVATLTVADDQYTYDLGSIPPGG
jgi:hypothetical protein